MRSLLLGKWWNTLGVNEQIFWSIAIVFSLLSLILFILDLFEEETEQTPVLIRRRNFLDATIILIFFTSFGWATVLSSLFTSQLVLIISIAIVVAALITFIYGLTFGFPWKNSLEKRKVLQSTGEVLEFIPSKGEGVGKVQLSIQRHPIKLDALTSGRELPVGVSISVIDIVDETVLVVEPIDGRAPNL